MEEFLFMIANEPLCVPWDSCPDLAAQCVAMFALVEARLFPPFQALELYDVTDGRSVVSKQMRVLLLVNELACQQTARDLDKIALAAAQLVFVSRPPEDQPDSNNDDHRPFDSEVMCNGR
jgi:hypothetical protein